MSIIKFCVLRSHREYPNTSTECPLKKPPKFLLDTVYILMESTFFELGVFIISSLDWILKLFDEHGYIGLPLGEFVIFELRILARKYQIFRL